jgi:hypothetical protein
MRFGSRTKLPFRYSSTFNYLYVEMTAYLAELLSLSGPYEDVGLGDCNVSIVVPGSLCSTYLPGVWWSQIRVPFVVSFDLFGARTSLCSFESVELFVSARMTS